MIYFLNQQKRIKKLRARKTAAAGHGLEKSTSKLALCR